MKQPAINRDAVLARHHVCVAGDGERILMFAHGFGCDQTMWRLVAPAFLATHRVVLFDYVGAGKSDLSAYDSCRYASLDGYALDVVEICDALQAKDVCLVGHSVSGMIGMLAAIERPDLFSSLVMVAPSPCYINDPTANYIGGFESQDLTGLLNLMDNNGLSWASFLATTAMQNPERPELTQMLEKSFCATDPDVVRQFAEVTFFSDHRAYLQRCTTRALIMQCTNDSIAPVEVGDYMHERLAGSTLRRLQATGHCPHVSHPEETISVIRDYLAS
jgi:sigma-B regulation protein RsbQ